MAKKTSGQNPVDEAYLRSLMAGGPSEPLSSPAPSITGESGGNRATALSDEKGKADNNVNGTVRDISGADDIGCSELVTDKPSPKTIRTTLADFIRKFLTPYKCEGRHVRHRLYRSGYRFSLCLQTYDTPLSFTNDYFVIVIFLN